MSFKELTPPRIDHEPQQRTGPKGIRTSPDVKLFAIPFRSSGFRYIRYRLKFNQTSLEKLARHGITLKRKMRFRIYIDEERKQLALRADASGGFRIIEWAGSFAINSRQFSLLTLKTIDLEIHASRSNNYDFILRNFEPKQSARRAAR